MEVGTSVLVYISELGGDLPKGSSSYLKWKNLKSIKKEQ